ncbi:RNA polymerase-associated protein CTR9 homolog [Drosophila busckii]|uniref:RNA polymerase-associated protein CTR9 homolog n=1 Tax=Drosophila busckii TaxID=30019 RepID=UPI00083EAC93|nr:RNA polymerase-associated protein CTR9 homolog [Drosophila busckii]
MAEKPDENKVNRMMELLQTLISKRVSLHEWTVRALRCYHNAEYDEFVHLLKSAIKYGPSSYASYQADLLKVHTLLAAHYIRMTQQEPTSARAQLAQQVKHHMHAIDSLPASAESKERRLLLCRGFALLHQPQLADQYFRSVLQQQPYCLGALIGLACLAYNQAEYRVALGYLKTLLLRYPDAPAHVRVGIANCLLQLGELERARKFFTLAKQQSPHCIDALLGEAQLSLNKCERPSVIMGISYVCAAYAINHRHPHVLSWLCTYFYYRRDYNNLLVAAGNAFVNANTPQLRAQSCYQIARSYHAFRNFDRAFNFYGHAVRMRAKNYAPPHLGLAQIYIRRQQLQQAYQELRIVLQLLPQHRFSMLLLSTLYGELGQLQLSVQTFQQCQEDIASCLGLAVSYERARLFPQAISAQQSAINVWSKKQTAQPVPSEWLNNLGALQFHNSELQAALQTFCNALLQPQGKLNALTLIYNKARVLEEQHLHQQAELLYLQLLKNFPNYYSIHLRLGAMAYKCKQFKRALHCFQTVLQLDKNNVLARQFLAHYYVQLGDISQALFQYNVSMCRAELKSDCYMLIAVGNVCLLKLQKSLADGQVILAEQVLQQALMLYKKALQHNGSNLWAVNGIGAVLCTQGHLTVGSQIFKQLTDFNGGAMLNAGHVALELQQYTEAITAYRICLELPALHMPVWKIRQLLASALMEDGRLEEAKQELLKARHVAPQDDKVLLQLALIIKQLASDSFKAESADFEQLSRAERELSIARSIFLHLETNLEHRHTAHRQAKKCAKLLEHAPEKLQLLKQRTEIAVQENKEKKKHKKHKKRKTKNEAGTTTS